MKKKAKKQVKNVKLEPEQEVPTFEQAAEDARVTEDDDTEVEGIESGQPGQDSPGDNAVLEQEEFMEGLAGHHYKQDGR